MNVMGSEGVRECVCVNMRERGSVLRNAKTETLPHSRISPPHAARSVTYLHRYLEPSTDPIYLHLRLPPRSGSTFTHLYILKGTCSVADIKQHGSLLLCGAKCAQTSHTTPPCTSHSRSAAVVQSDHHHTSRNEIDTTSTPTTQHA